MTTSYASLDAAIVKAIQGNFHKLFYIASSQRALAGMATIRRCLQSLRKRGIIEYKNGRWSAVESVK